MAVKKTFEPWSEKVEIVQKYIGKETSEDFITLDSYFEGKEIDFIKADIEGAECDMLDGGIYTMKKISYALICLYHRYDDEKEILKRLENSNFETKINPRYVVIFEGNNPKQWVRHGVLNIRRY